MLASLAWLSAQLGALPLTFEPNRGQADPAVLYLARTPDWTLFLTADEGLIRFRSGAFGRPGPWAPPTLGLTWKGSAGAVKAEALGRQPGSSNYLIGPRKAWIRDVPQYKGVRLMGLYPGVDLSFHGSEGRQLEFDWIIAPGPGEERVGLELSGVEGLRMDWLGDLRLELPDGRRLTLKAPRAYQRVGGVRHAVAAAYRLQGGHRIGLWLGGHDPRRSVVVDPVLVYSTFLGGSHSFAGEGDMATAVAVDAAGNAYVTGVTFSADFPVHNPEQGALAPIANAFVTKCDPSGTTLIYSTYVGGGGETGIGIAVDLSGCAYVAGGTNSAAFPVVNAFQSGLGGAPSRAFVFKLNVAGNALVYSTYLGGSRADGAEAIAVDNAGHAFVTGYTTSPDFPLQGAYQSSFLGAQDAFVTELGVSGSTLVYSTYLGGTGQSGGYGVAVDVSGNACVAGGTNAADFPTLNAVQASLGGSWDAFVTKFNASGSSLVYSTYLGGSAYDSGQAIAVDPAGNAYVAGATSSTNFPLASALQASLAGSSNAFVAEFPPSGAPLAYASYLGGSGTDSAHAIAVDAAGEAYVAGSTSSPDFPVLGAVQGALAGAQNAFVTEIGPAGSALVYSTYFGGGSEVARGIAVDAAGGAVVAGYTGAGAFPLLHPFQAVCGSCAAGGTNGIVFKLGLPSRTPTPSFTASPVQSPSPTLTQTMSPIFSRTPSATPTVTLSPTLTATPSPTSSATPSPVQSLTASMSPTISVTATCTPAPLILHAYAPNPDPAGPAGVHLPYWLQTAALVRIRVFTVSGELVRSLAPVAAPAGVSEEFWDARNDAGQGAASGVFIARIQADSPAGESRVVWEKLALIR